MTTLIQASLPCRWCSSSDAMSEYVDNWYCFSCKHSEQKSTFEKKLAVPKQADSKELVLPEYGKHSKESLAWLYKHYVTPEQIAIYRIGFDPISQRTILPVYNSRGELVSYEARGSNPKYLVYGTKKIPWICFPRLEPLGKKAKVIIVEDILSAIRVSDVGSGLALRGTKLHDTTFSIIKSMHKFYDVEIILWLDSDKPGQDAARQILTRLKWICDVKNIKTPKDPKAYSKTEIEKIIRQ